MSPSRRFESPILTAPSRCVPIARFVTYPLGCAIALCSPRDDSSRRFSLGRAFALCPPCDNPLISSGQRHHAMSPLRQSVDILWAAPVRYVPPSRRFVGYKSRAFAPCPPGKKIGRLYWAAPSRYAPLAMIRSQIIWPHLRPCPLAMIRSQIIWPRLRPCPLAMIRSQIIWPRLRPCPLAMIRSQIIWPRLRPCPLAMIRCLWAAPSRLPLAIICSQIFWPRLRVYPLATIHCQYSFGRHNKSVFHCHFGRACLPQDFVVAIATLLHRRLHVPSRRIVILPFLRLRHCALAGLFLPITRQAYPGHMYCAETLDLCLCTGIVGITPN
jgi:hypothetical protein